MSKSTAKQLADCRRIIAARNAALADPVPPAGGEPEVKRWLANWGMEEMFQYSGGDYVAYEDHADIVTRLQAEVERLSRDCAILYKLNGELWEERDALQSELTKARELLSESLPALEQAASAFKAAKPVRNKVRAYLANQSAPAAKDE